ncbi:MAG: AMIN domain-containing protein [Desulfobulbaceae bacterium]|nr:AMIN domain-containing protein [Desulfobulbaceae bacterium]
MNILRVKTLISMILTLFMAAAFCSRCWAEESSYQASTIVFAKDGGGLALTIKGNMSPTFTTYQLFDPLRVIIDIANASFAESLHLPIEVNQAPVAKISGSVLAEKQPVIAKLEVLLSSDSQYTVKRNGNDITLVFSADKTEKNEAPPAPATAAPEPKMVPELKNSPGRPEIYDLKIGKEAGQVTVLLVADGPIQEFTKVALAKGDGRPDRMYIDIPGVKAPALDRKMKVGAGGVSQIRISDRAEGARFVFDSSMDKLFAFSVAPAPEGLLVSIGDGDTEAAPQETVKAPESDLVSKILASSKEEPRKKPSSSKPSPKAGNGDEFAEAGYNREKISVDFYKTNLHNVFRLMGEVGGYNIVIDESVSGVLTLSLREVPWDFLLDVILNLKSLQKVERYNTIVISAKDKGFVWPEKPINEKEDFLVETPSQEMGVEISKQLNQPPAVLEAKRIIQQGNSLAKEGKFKEALGLYQSALDKWPDNADLAKRMAGMCLVDLGYNQAAVDYAKKALAINGHDPEAALQAAVGLANMRQPEARLYFEKAISTSKPSRSALLSYAGFQEENENYTGAIATLTKFTELYSASLETMIARARIFDKQGNSDLAVKEYKSIMYSGYDLAPDLAQYIKGRIALANKQ